MSGPVPVHSPMKQTPAFSELVRHPRNFDNKANYIALGHQLMPRVVGPIPVRTLLDERLPLDITPDAHGKIAKMSDFSKVLTARKGVLNIVANLCACANPLMSSMTLCDTQHVRPASDVPDPYPATRTDLCSYSNAYNGDRVDNSAGVDDSDDGSAKREDDKDKDYDPNGGKGKNDASKMEFTGELKPHDIFNDDVVDGRVFARPTDDGLEWLGQMGQVVQNVMAKQNRTHHWSLFVETNGWVRILRWDRAVILVSQRFKFCKKESLELAEFFYRISRVPREVVGHDTTIRPASEIEACRAVPHLNDFKDNFTIYDVPKSFSPLSSIENLEDYIAIEVPDDDGRRTVIAHKLRWTKEDAMSRATRGYVAFDLKAGRICYLKDSWPVAHLVTHEHELLRQLKEHKVPNVPTFVCGGIIANHRSLSPDDVSHEWNKGCVVFQPRDHQRFLVEEVGVSLSVPLEAARTSRSRDLVCRLIEIVTAHQAAFATAKILHRDISEGNALHMRWSKNGVVTVKALLIDWDMAKSTTAMATRFERTGTWFFLSINLLSDDPFLQSFSDDLESVLWLLVYHVLRFLPWQQGLRAITKASVKLLIDKIFQDEQYDDSLGRYVGGSRKIAFINRARELQFPGNKGATTCLRTLLKQLQSFLDTRSEFISEQMELQEHSKLPTDPDEDQQDNGPHPEEPQTGHLVFGNHALFLECLKNLTGNAADWPIDDGWHDQLPDHPSPLGSSIIPPLTRSHTEIQTEHRRSSRDALLSKMNATRPNTHQGTKRSSDSRDDEQPGEAEADDAETSGQGSSRKKFKQAEQNMR